jgi:hypothetical protein
LICTGSTSLPNDASALESAISALEKAITALDKSSGNWERLLQLFTALVVLGIFVEIRVILLEHRDSTDSWLRGIVWPPERPSRALLAWALFGPILVTVGVAGEVWVGVEITRINGDLRSKNAELRSKTEQLIALITSEAGTAKASADGAATAASEATASAKVIGEQATLLEATTKRLIWQGPRDILLSNAAHSFRRLKRFSGQKFRFSVCRSDLNSTGMITISLTEVERTQEAIYLLLSQAGWKIAAIPGLPAGIPFPYIADNCASVSVTANPSASATKRTRDAAEALQSVLNRVLSANGKVGLGADLSPDPGPDVVDIHVGMHPAQPKPLASKRK